MWKKIFAPADTLPHWLAIGRLVALACAIGVIAYMGTQLKIAWDVWRSGIHSAQRATDKAAGELQEGKGALEQSSEETRRVLREFETAQAAIRGLSQQIAVERRAADQLRAQLAAAQKERAAQPLPTTLKEVQDDLATLHPAYRAAR